MKVNNLNKTAGRKVKVNKVGNQEVLSQLTRIYYDLVSQLSTSRKAKKKLTRSDLSTDVFVDNLHLHPPPGSSILV